MAKQFVKVLQSFRHVTPMSALILDGREIRPATEIVSTYEAGQEVGFHTKKDALAFVKFHGDKVEYIGRK